MSLRIAVLVLALGMGGAAAETFEVGPVRVIAEPDAKLPEVDAVFYAREITKEGTTYTLKGPAGLNCVGRQVHLHAKDGMKIRVPEENQVIIEGDSIKGWAGDIVGPRLSAEKLRIRLHNVRWRFVTPADIRDVEQQVDAKVLAEGTAERVLEYVVREAQRGNFLPSMRLQDTKKLAAKLRRDQDTIRETGIDPKTIAELSDDELVLRAAKGKYWLDFMQVFLISVIHKDDAHLQFRLVGVEADPVSSLVRRDGRWTMED